MQRAHDEHESAASQSRGVAVATGGSLPARVLALQRTAGNAGVGRLLQRRGDYEEEWRNHRRWWESEANRRAKTYVGGKHQSESFDLLEGLLREWYPAYLKRKGTDFLWNTDFAQKEMLKVVRYQ